MQIDPDLVEALPQAFVVLSQCLAQLVDRDAVEQTIENILADGETFEALSVQQRNIIWDLCQLAIRTGYDEKSVDGP